MVNGIDVRPAATRPHTKLSWLDSRHSFSFGNHYDPANVGHGLLLVNNDDQVAGGGGFGTHSHSDMEIVTWVLSGRLLHSDSEGNRGELYPGLVQRMSAGRGIRHSEMNASPTEPVHFIQMWVPPDTQGLAPSYEQRDLQEVLAQGGLHPLASGQGHDGAVTIHQRAAVLWGARLGPGEVVKVPASAFAHVFVAIGEATLEGAGALTEGDAVRFTDSGALDLAGGDQGAEILIWTS